MTPANIGRLTDTSAQDIVRSAGLNRQWCALVYESFLLAALLLVAGFAVLPLIGPLHGETANAGQRLYVLPATPRALLFVFYVAVTGIYCVGFWSNGRRTLAMKTWGLALATADGGPVDLRHALRRYLAAWIGPAAGLIGMYLWGGWGLAAGLLNYCWGWLDGEGRFLHDRIAGTRIIRV